jgi:hypothetical protein
MNDLSLSTIAFATITRQRCRSIPVRVVAHVTTITVHHGDIGVIAINCSLRRSFLVKALRSWSTSISTDRYTSNLLHRQRHLRFLGRSTTLP